MKYQCYSMPYGTSIQIEANSVREAADKYYQSLSIKPPAQGHFLHEVIVCDEQKRIIDSVSVKRKASR